MTFETFMEHVDSFLEANFGIIADDLPDYDYRTAYDAGYSPSEAAADAYVEAVYS